MTTGVPEGEAIRKAIKWVSAALEEEPDSDVRVLVNKAITRFDMSPKDADFLMRFYKEATKPDISELG